jgi:hypothetical protein
MANNIGKETWKNATQGTVYVLKSDRRGDLEHERVRSGGTILLTPDERAINQDKAANDGLDIFKNGIMVPVRLLDSTEDKAAIESNPNLKTEDELRAMFKLQWKKFEAEVSEISNVTTLNRLRQIAMEGDATVRQVNVIESRIADVDSRKAVVDVTIQNYGSIPQTGGKATPVR